MYLQAVLLSVASIFSNPIEANINKKRIKAIDNIQSIKIARDYVKERGIKDSKSLIIVNINKQNLTLFQDNIKVKTYRASTSLRGYGQKLGSNRTPIGLHRISEKIGFGAKKNAVFKARKVVGYYPSYAKGKKAGDFIVSRVLRLEGLEPGLNKGKDKFGDNVDTKQRTVYIHGSLAESRIGTPITPGCVFLTQNDVIDLFKRIPVGTQVIITV